jgi:hypothetical protein
MLETDSANHEGNQSLCERNLPDACHWAVNPGRSDRCGGFPRAGHRRVCRCRTLPAEDISAVHGAVSGIAKIEIICADDQVDRFVRVLREPSYTGEREDGRIFVLNIERAINIRSGEEGEKAL